MFSRKISGMPAVPHGGVTLPEDTVRREASRVHSEQPRAWRQRRRAWSAAQVVARVRGDDTPSEPESLGGDDKEEDEGKEEREVTSHPHSPPLEDLPSLGDFFSQ
jgi:hypothetical protein